MKLQIRDDLYTIKSVVKKVHNFTLITLLKDGLLWALTLHDDHYRLYPPLGQVSLCFSDRPLSDISMILEHSDEKPPVFLNFPIKG